ncbi:MAG: squalene synthase HpnC [Bacteroidota bacterium]|nr:squalene synthase HpnC [Bacteroidota bacterium]
MTLDDAYRSCMQLARSHYENFPVASHLMPRRLRPHVAAVYAFARHADDFADEGHMSGAERRAKLEQWRAQLRRAAAGEAEHPVFMALGDTMRRFTIPEQLFHDLLDAFVQDTAKESYADFDELLDYCRRSANPVGRIILALFGRLDEESASPSDALCTALQLTNFWQDVSVDRRKPRVYIPADSLAAQGLTPADVLAGEDNHRLRTVVAGEVERTRVFFHRALPLLPLVPFRLRLELRAIWLGGMKVLEKIEKQEYTVVQSRPALSLFDVISVFADAVLKGKPDARS